MGRKRESNASLSNIPNKRNRTRVPDEAEETSESIATQNSQTSFSNSSIVDRSIRSGKISKIILKNFMCHENLLLDFNKNVNLLIGNNGSGKSAILTALIVGLGSKSSATSRCTKIAQLIKRGESSASVEIHIANNCDQSYDAETYGREIIVQRTFSINGSSTYRVKSASGQVISNSRKDLLKILLFLNIQVDNPVCVLNQDASRAFLKESDPKKRFQFFLKATQIDTVIEKLNDCSIHYTTGKKQWEYQKTLIASLKKEVASIQAKYYSLQSYDYLKQNLATYKLEMLWLKVQNEENLFAEITETLSTFQQAYDDFIKSMSDKQRDEESHRAKRVLLMEQINQIKSDMQGDVQRKDEMKRNILKHSEAVNEVERQLKKINTKVNRNNTNITQLENDMSESSESQIGRVAMVKKANEAKLEKLREKKAETESVKANLQRDIEMMTNTKDVLEENVNQLRDKRRGIVRSKEKLAAEIRQCETSKNSLSMYGKFMPDLVDAIEKMHRKGEFRELPRGPLGKYVEVKDDKWKALIEGTIGTKIFSFCVNDTRDRDVLNRLISTRFPEAKKCSIIVTRFTNQVHDIRSGKVRSLPNTYCVFDLIKCSDPVVLNTLIDFCKIETILLTEDEQVAFNVTNDEENVPEHLLKVLLLKPPTEMFPAPSVRMYALKIQPPRFLQVNMKERKDYLMGEMRDAETRLAEITEKIENDEGKKNSLAKTISEKSRFRDKTEDDLYTVVQNITQIEKIEYPGENERNLLVAELEELHRTREELVLERQSVKQRFEEVKSALDLKKIELKNIDECLQFYNNKINDKQLEIYAMDDMRASNSTNSRYESQKAAKLKVDLDKLQKEHSECNKKIATLTATARNHGERIPVSNANEFLSAKIKETEQIMKKVAESKESLEHVKEVLDQKTAELSEKQELVENLEKTLLKLRESRKDRYQWLIRFKSHVSLRVQHEFNRIMKLRNFDGTITIDHNKEVLELSVIPRDKDIPNAVSSASCLSGGERSFSTVALLLALWSVVDSPFYFLDEYDVYTDTINRYYMTTLLLNEAKKKTHRQYTFLTPQDMSQITASHDLSIQRMVDPVRK